MCMILQHLASSQHIVREFEVHLKTVAGERDAALVQLQHTDGKLKAAADRVQQAENMEVGAWGRGSPG